MEDFCRPCRPCRAGVLRTCGPCPGTGVPEEGCTTPGCTARRRREGAGLSARSLSNWWCTIGGLSARWRAGRGRAAPAAQGRDGRCAVPARLRKKETVPGRRAYCDRQARILLRPPQGARPPYLRALRERQSRGGFGVGGLGKEYRLAGSGCAHRVRVSGSGASREYREGRRWQSVQPGLVVGPLPGRGDHGTVLPWHSGCPRRRHWESFARISGMHGWQRMRLRHLGPGSGRYPAMGLRRASWPAPETTAPPAGTQAAWCAILGVSGEFIVLYPSVHAVIPYPRAAAGCRSSVVIPERLEHAEKATACTFDHPLG